MTQKPITKEYLERAGLYYLSRYSSSEQNFREVLRRKVMRRTDAFSSIKDLHQEWIEDVVTKCLRLGYIDDLLYATQKIRAMQHAGKSTNAIKNMLRMKGVSQDIATKAFSEVNGGEEESPDVRAAFVYARKRRFGPYRQLKATDDLATVKKKEFASMARVGFRFDVIKNVIDAESESEF